MPKKSQRVASRQAQLSGRAKRERTHGPAGVPATNPSTQASGAAGEGGASVERQRFTHATAQDAQPQESQRFTPGAGARPHGRMPQLPPIETYFAPELRRIGLVIGVVAVVLVVLIFVLR